MSKKEVVIVQRRLTHYREALFEKLRAYLNKNDVSLRLLIGEPNKVEAQKRDSGHLEWAERIPTYYFGELCWQPFRRFIKKSDMVIITQENKLLYNLLALSIFRPKKIAFWGHGGNLQLKKPTSLKEKFKLWTTSKADWWFAYTELSVELVKQSGFPVKRITNLENAVDTESLALNVANAKGGANIEHDTRLGLLGGPTGIFVGSLYADKRIDFLLEAAYKLHEMDPSFRLLIVGDGPLHSLVTEYCMQNSWCLWLGARSGYEKALYLSLADVYLNPGLVGLGVLDSFAAGVPMVTTRCGLHSPEIAYLKNGENGLITENSLDAFVLGVMSVIYNNGYKESLVDGCCKSAQYYTISNMADNFCEGILRALSQ